MRILVVRIVELPRCRHHCCMARRVFLGLTEVAGYFAGLEHGFRTLGVEARLFDLSANPLGYGRGGSGERRPQRAKLLRLGKAPAGTWRRRTWDGLLRVNRTARTVRALMLLPVALLRYDTFILAGGGLFADGRELALLRRLGKDVIVVFLGSDHRPPYLNGIWVRDAMVIGYDQIARDTVAIRDRVRRVERGSTTVVALPASAQFHDRPYVNFLAIGFPFAPPMEGHTRAQIAGDRVVALHCPTNPASKGTAENSGRHRHAPRARAGHRLPGDDGSASSGCHRGDSRRGLRDR